MRNAFAEAICEISLTNKNLFLLYGDIGNKLFDKFKQQNPKNFVNAGVAEASMVGIASGLTRSDFIPIVYTINSFLSLKAIEQIKLDICYQNLPVILVGTGSALSYAELGTTHHSLEDFAILSCIPNLQVIAPSDPIELRACLKWAIQSRKPTYIRIGKKGETNIHETEIDSGLDFFGPFLSSKELSSQNALVSAGTVSAEAQLAVQELRRQKRKFDHILFPQISPPNIDAMVEILRKYEAVWVIEEHVRNGGLLTQFLHSAQENHLIEARIYGINAGQTFYKGLGGLSEARRSIGLDNKSIVQRILSELI